MKTIIPLQMYYKTTKYNLLLNPTKNNSRINPTKNNSRINPTKYSEFTNATYFYEWNSNKLFPVEVTSELISTECYVCRYVYHGMYVCQPR